MRASKSGAEENVDIFNVVSLWSQLRLINGCHPPERAGDQLVRDKDLMPVTQICSLTWDNPPVDKKTGGVKVGEHGCGLELELSAISIIGKYVLHWQSSKVDANMSEVSDQVTEAEAGCTWNYTDCHGGFSYVILGLSVNLGFRWKHCCM